ncbi:MAG: type 1 glutamine amidotransferase, partial [Dongiaceae bacterium]
PTAAGRAEIPDGLHVVQSHYHEFALPAGATLLATSALYTHQAFRHGRAAYGLQFHAEVTPAIFRRWQTDHARATPASPASSRRTNRTAPSPGTTPPSTPGSRDSSTGCSGRATRAEYLDCRLPNGFRRRPDRSSRPSRDLMAPRSS